jgi:general secretion pathway protein G
MTSQNRRSLRLRAEAGFSLLEILIVVAIMGLLIGVVGPNVIGQFQNSKRKTAEIQIEQIKAALDTFVMDVGRYPTESEGLEALVDPGRRIPGWNGPYLRGGKVPMDPWNRPYRYGEQQGQMRVMSLGADGVAGGSGLNADIVR